MSARLPLSLADPRPRREDFQRATNHRLAVFSEWLRQPLRWTAQRLTNRIEPTPPPQWRNGLIIGPTHIGDILYNTASLPALRTGLPNCEWTYLVTGTAGEVLQGNPHLKEIISVDESRNFKTRLEKSRVALSGRRFDVAIAYAGGTSWQDLILATLLKIPNRVGYVHKGFSGLVTHPVSIHVPQSFPAYFRDLVGQLVDEPNSIVSSLRPLVYPGPQHEQAADEVGSRIGLVWSKAPVLACAVTSRQPSGVWPREQFLETVRLVRDLQACTVVYLGAKRDAEELTDLARKTGADTYVIAGDLELPSVVAFLRRCQIALTSDSGPRHLANAAGIPVVFVRNMSFRKEEAGAYCSTDHDMAPSDREFLRPEEMAAAFAEVDVEKVANKIVSLLRVPPSSAKD